MTSVRRPLAGLVLAAAAALVAAPAAGAAKKARSAPAAARSAAAASSRPDAALYAEAQAAETRLRASAKRMAQRAEWEAVVVRYRKVVARYPRSGYCDNALLAAGSLYREMAERFEARQYRDDALAAYRTLVMEYPSSSLGDDALWFAVEVARKGSDRRKVVETARAYLETYPEGERAAKAKALLREREPAIPLPKTPPPGLARVFDLRAWSGEATTRVVVYLERKVEIQSDRAYGPDRLWVDLVGTRLHPNLAQRTFPVGDGLLEQVRIAQNRDDVVRVVLDFKDVWEHQVFQLDDPVRLVIDVRGRARAGAQTATGRRPDAGAAPAVPQPGSGALQEAPTQRVDAMLEPSPSGAAAAPIDIRGVDRLRGSPPTPTTRTAAAPPPPPPAATVAAPPAPTLAAPEPPAANRAGNYSLARQLGLTARRIVIDAGHGGHDPGTIGRRGLQEKDLVLDVALRLERLVRQELRTDVILTRSTDVFVPLEERTAIANQKEADLFVSIHANASRNPTANGIETYYLNFAKSPHAEQVAARENAISPATLKDLQNLVKAITLNSKIDESRDLASSIQESMVSGAGEQHDANDRGVHTAPFYVLIGANMPAVLAEIAFVTHPEDEKRLKTPEYRELVARSLLRGLRGYLEALDRTPSRQLTDAGRRPTVARGR
ncbi:MAG TPA: N-acetylmuramoyl-L-alanine amidase [Vicinamibacteria bacterium]